VSGSIDYRYAWRNGWRWVGWFLRYHRLIAAARQAWLAYVRGYISETCERCGRAYFLWHAPDDLWSQVTGHPQREGDIAAGLYCPACFDRKADRLGITLKWRPEVLIARPKIGASDDSHA
jgi:hypothetical protein